MFTPTWILTYNFIYTLSLYSLSWSCQLKPSNGWLCSEIWLFTSNLFYPSLGWLLWRKLYAKPSIFLMCALDKNMCLILCANICCQCNCSELLDNQNFAIFDAIFWEKQVFSCVLNVRDMNLMWQKVIIIIKKCSKGTI